MKKVFTLAAALMLAFSAFAENVYFKITPATAFWANDGAKIGAYFSVGTEPFDEGAYAQFFTLVPGTTDTYVGTVPESEEEPFITVRFLRYSSAASDPEDMNYWNATGIETWDGVNNVFTATASGDTWDSTTGNWSAYITSTDEAGADAAVKVQKVLINGQVLLLSGDKTYNLLGVEVK